MSKKLMIAVLSVVLLIGGASTALAATDEGTLNEIKDLYRQIFGLQQQIIDKQAEAGAITKEQADLFKKNLELNQQYQEEAIENGDVYGAGLHCGGNGAGGYGMGGYGSGYGMMGGYGPGYGPGAGSPAPSGYNY